MTDPGPYGPTPPAFVYQQIVRAPSNGAAVAALVLGIVAIALGIWIPIPLLGLILMVLAFVPAVLAVVFGHLGLRTGRQNGIGRGHALAGLVLGYVTLAISVVTSLFWIVLSLLSVGSASTTNALGLL